MSRKKQIVNVFIPITIFAFFLLLATFFDLEINKLLFYPETIYANFFDKFGTFPSYIAAPVVCIILSGQDFFKNKTGNILLKIVLFILASIGFYVFYTWFFGNISTQIPNIVVQSVIYSIITSGLFVFLCNYISKETIKKLLIFAICLAVIAILTSVIIDLMKTIWARERFRVMVGALDRRMMETGDYSGFSPWYLPQIFFERSDVYEKLKLGIDATMGYQNDAFRSFPSGHTGGASISFALIIIPEVFKNKISKKSKIIYYAIPILFTVLVGVSRIVIGAHYLSDILFGGTIGALMAVGARTLVRKFYKG